MRRAMTDEQRMIAWLCGIAIGLLIAVMIIDATGCAHAATLPDEPSIGVPARWRPVRSGCDRWEPAIGCWMGWAPSFDGCRWRCAEPMR